MILIYFLYLSKKKDQITSQKKWIHQRYPTLKKIEKY